MIDLILVDVSVGCVVAGVDVARGCPCRPRPRCCDGSKKPRGRGEEGQWWLEIVIGC